MSSGIVLLVFLAFSAGLIATGLMRRYALQRNLLDVPNSRSSHTLPTPRGGGVAVVLSFFLAILLLKSMGLIDLRLFGALLIGGGATALIGLLDDRWHIRPSVRFGVHLAAAVLAITMIGGISEGALAHWGLHGVWTGRVVAVLTVIWTTNLFNFMDGLDGIAGSEAIFVGGTGAWLNWRDTGDLGGVSCCHQPGVPAMELAACTYFPGRRG
jgi:Fuc2NAc and GlcNAc transferase